MREASIYIYIYILVVIVIIHSNISKILFDFNKFLAKIWHTIKPGTPEHGTLAEQRDTPEQWRNNGTPAEHQWNTPEYQRNNNVTLTKHPGTTKPHETKKYCSVF